MLRMRFLLCLALAAGLAVPGEVSGIPAAQAIVVTQSTPGPPRTIPALQQWTPGTGSFAFTANSEVDIDDATWGYHPQEIYAAAETFAGELSDLEGRNVRVNWEYYPRAGDIFLSLRSADLGLGAEGYSMSVGSGLQILANTGTGLFYGTRSVLQALRAGPTIGAGTARDWPAYPDRGLMVDIGRKYFSYQWLQDQIRDAAYLKMNYVHLHLSDGLGFRIESTTHPEAMSAQYLTKQQVKDLIVFADMYHVQIVPEIDMPGHMSQILLHHLDLRLTSVTGKVSSGYIDLSNPNSYTLMSDLIHEYLPLFPGKYWHLGADEYITDYQNYPQLLTFAQQKYGASAKPKDTFYYFINWANDIVRAAGKTMRIWNDGIMSSSGSSVLSGLVAPAGNIDIDYWHGVGMTPAALVAAGHSVLNASYHPTYYILGGNKPDTQYMYESWNPGLYEPRTVGGIAQTLTDQTNDQGGVLHVWCDYPNAETEQQVAAGIMNPLRVLAQQDWGSPKLVTSYADFQPIIAAVGRPPRYGYDPIPITDMADFVPGGYYPVANIFDGWPDTEFEAMPSSTSNYVGVDLSSLRDIAVVSIDAWAHAQDSAPTSLIVEFSADNVTWRTLPTPPGTLSVHIAVPAGTYARYVRMRLTNSQPPWWLAVYDFTVDFRSVS